MGYQFVLGGTSQQAALQNVSICFSVFIGFFLCTRAYTRLFLVRAIGIEDGMVLMAGLLGITACTVTIINTGFGLGEHLEYVETYRSTEDLYSLFKLIFSYSLLYYIATSIAKLSIAMMMLRIFPQRWFRNFIFVIMTCITTSCMSSIAVSVIVKWTFVEHTKERDIEVKFNYIFSSLNACFDFSLVAVPLPLVWQLQMPLRTRIPVCMLFATGLLGCVASLIRLGTIHYLLNPDTTWYFATCIVWTTVEGSIAIICAIVPVLKPFFDRVLPKILPGKWATTTQSGHTSAHRTGHSRRSHLDRSVLESDMHELKLSPAGITRGGCFPAPPGFDDDMIPVDGVHIKHEYNVVTSFEPKKLDDSGSDIERTISEMEDGITDFTKPAKAVWR